MRQDRRQTSLIERLEDRRLLSGNVTVELTDGNLSIRGDSVANDIVVDQMGLNEGQVRISSGSSATTINGQATPLLLEGLTGDVMISLRQGPDSLSIRDMTIPADLTVEMGMGMDHVALQNLTIAGNTDIRTGVRADSIEIDDTIFTGALYLDAKWGADSLRIEQNGAADGVRSFFNGPVEIHMNRGDDQVRLGLDANAGNRVVFYQNVAFFGGEGNDELMQGDGNWFDFTPSVTNFEYNGLAAA